MTRTLWTGPWRLLHDRQWVRPFLTPGNPIGGLRYGPNVDQDAKMAAIDEARFWRRLWATRDAVQATSLRASRGWVE